MRVKNEKRETFQLQLGGDKVFGVIHYPVDVQAGSPAVLMLHGLGGHKVGMYRLYVDLAEALTSIGIIAMRIDFRGAGDSEGAFADMTIESQVEDAEAALRFLKNDPLVDAARIGILGRSFGGMISILTALQNPSVKSLALWAPLFSGQPWLHHWKMAQSKALQEGGKLPAMQINGMYPGMGLFKQLFTVDLEAQMAALNHIPLLHISGEKDQIITDFHTEKYRATRQGASENLFLRYAESDHDFSDTVERNMALKQTVDWFQKTLI